MMTFKEYLMESDPKRPARVEYLKHVDNEATPDDQKPTRHRAGQKSGRSLRKMGFLNKSKNAAEYSHNA